MTLNRCHIIEIFRTSKYKKVKRIPGDEGSGEPSLIFLPEWELNPVIELSILVAGTSEVAGI
jgi:hypothetical protein